MSRPKEHDDIVKSILDVALPVIGQQIQDKVVEHLNLDDLAKFNIITSIALSVVGTIINNFQHADVRDKIATIVSMMIMNSFHSVMAATQMTDPDSTNPEKMN